MKVAIHGIPDWPPAAEWVDSGRPSGHRGKARKMASFQGALQRVSLTRQAWILPTTLT